MIADRLPSIRGWMTLSVWRGGNLVRRDAGQNTIVSGMFPVVADLLAGGGSPITHGGTGTNSAGALSSDAGLTDVILLPIAATTDGRMCRLIYTLPPDQGNGLTIAEYGLFCGGRMVARTTKSPILKAADIALAVDWVIDCGGGV